MKYYKSQWDDSTSPTGAIQQFQHSKRGFGILEVLIASSMLIITIGAVAALARSAIRSNIISLERAQAYNLAREGIEIIRANRDTKWVDKDPNNEWDTDFSGDFGGDEKQCTFRKTYETSQINCNSSVSEVIVLDLIQFSRSFTIEKVGDTFNQKIADQTESVYLNNTDNNNNALLTKINVKIVWKSYGKEREVNAPIILTNWKPQ